MNENLNGKKRELSADEMESVSGGNGSNTEKGGYILGSDGNTYEMVYRTDECCPKFICKRCGASNYEHEARHCRLSETVRNTCEACSYYDAVNPVCGACRVNGKPKG